MLLKQNQLHIEVENLLSTLPAHTEEVAYLNQSVMQQVTQLTQTQVQFKATCSYVRTKADEAVLNTWKYTTLKRRVQKERMLYDAQGDHHQDRKDSLDRLLSKIATLDKNNKISPKDRFIQLLKDIHLEEMATAKSHEKIGFFGKWRPCRLQKMYLKIINEFATDDPYSIPELATEEDHQHQKRVSAFNIT